MDTNLSRIIMYHPTTHLSIRPRSFSSTSPSSTTRTRVAIETKLSSESLYQVQRSLFRICRTTIPCDVITLNTTLQKRWNNINTFELWTVKYEIQSSLIIKIRNTTPTGQWSVVIVERRSTFSAKKERHKYNDCGGVSQTAPDSLSNSLRTNTF